MAVIPLPERLDGCRCFKFCKKTKNGAPNDRSGRKSEGRDWQPKKVLEALQTYSSSQDYRVLNIKAGTDEKVLKGKASEFLAG